MFLKISFHLTFLTEEVFETVVFPIEEKTTEIYESYVT
jgi:hypothetical protein